MNGIIVKTSKEAGVSFEAIYEMMMASYVQLTDAGIDTPLLHWSQEEFQRSVRHAVVFVALDTETGELLGTHSFTANRQRGYMHGFCLAIAPNAKRCGVGTRMLEVETERIRKAGYTYLRGTTPIVSTWSINWHLRNGYRIIGYQRRPQDNHPLYVFRKQLVPPSTCHLRYSLYSCALFCRLRFIASYVVTRLTKDSNGNLNVLGRIIISCCHQFGMVR